MGKIFYIVFVITFCAFSEVMSLRCYVCSNCAEISSQQLQTCGDTEIITTTVLPESTSTTSTPPIDNSTTPVDNSTTITTPATPPVDNSTTPIDNSTTVTTPATPPVDNTTTPVDNSTTVTTPATPPVDNTTTPVNNSTTVTTPATPPVDNTTTPVDNSTTITTPATPPVDNSTTPVDNSTTVTTTATPPVDNSTIPVDNSTTVTTPATPPIDNSTTPVDNSTTVTTPTSPPVDNSTTSTDVNTSSRVKREALNNDICVCKDIINCDCNRWHSRKKRAESNNTITYVCVKDEVTVNETTIINRGCAVLQNTTEATCTGANFSSSCNTCDTDGCNAAVTYKSSLAVLVSLYLLSFV